MSEHLFNQPVQPTPTVEAYKEKAWYCTFTLGTEAAHVRTCAIQVYNFGNAPSQSVALTLIPSATATGVADNTNNTITLTSGGAGILTKPQATGSLDILAETGSTGLLNLDMTQASATGDRYIRVVMPDGTVVTSAVIAFAGAFE
jgi:hypothetical protein